MVFLMLAGVDKNESYMITGTNWNRWNMFIQAFNNLDNILRREAGCATELDYIEQTSSWLIPQLPAKAVSTINSCISSLQYEIHHNYLLLLFTVLSQGNDWRYNGLVVFKIECLIHIDLSRSKNPAIARSCCT